jgi:group I intron endonuclease
MIGIYRIISPSEKIYIGQTINSTNRFKKYNSLNCKNQPRLYNSFLKYGYLNHIIEIIEECKVEELNIKERYWQDYYDVIGENGLNCLLTRTDVLPQKISKNTILKIKNSCKNKIISEESKLKMSITRKGKKHSEQHRLALKVKGRNKGKKHSEKTKLLMSLSKKGSKHSLAKKVICTETNKIWNTISECANDNNLKITTLYARLSGQNKNKTTLKFYINENY